MLAGKQRAQSFQPKFPENFGPKLNGSVGSNRKSFEKTGPPFEVDHFSRSDRSEFWLNGSRLKPYGRHLDPFPLDYDLKSPFFLRNSSHVGWFSSALAFSSLYYPWGKMGITRSLPFRQKNKVLSVVTRKCVRASRVLCFRCVHPAIHREIFVVSISCKSAPYKVNTWIINNLFVENEDRFLS